MLQQFNFLKRSRNILHNENTLFRLLSILKTKRLIRQKKSPINLLKQKLRKLNISVALKHYVKSGRVHYSIKPQTESSRLFWSWKLLLESTAESYKNLFYRLSQELRNPIATKQLRKKKIETILEARLNYRYKRRYIFRKFIRKKYRKIRKFVKRYRAYKKKFRLRRNTKI